jgi:hypothetical protein
LRGRLQASQLSPPPSGPASGPLGVDRLGPRFDRLRPAPGEHSGPLGGGFGRRGSHNPTTITLDEERRHALATIARRHNVLIIEDDVYRSRLDDPRRPSRLWSGADSPRQLPVQKHRPGSALRLCCRPSGASWPRRHSAAETAGASIRSRRLSRPRVWRRIGEQDHRSTAH